MRPRFKIVIGLFAVLSLVVFASGIYLQVTGALSGFSGDLANSVSISLLGFALCVAAVAFLYYGIRQAVAESDFIDRREAHPAEPWRWNKQWASNILKSSDKFPFGILVAAILWNVVTVTLSIVALPAFESETSAVKWILLGLPLVGFTLAVYAISSITRWLRFGATTFVLDEMPVTPGNVLSGTAFTAIASEMEPDEGFLVSLSCKREISRRQKVGFGKEQVLLWRDERRFQGVTSSKHKGVLAIPLFFRLPENASPTNYDGDKVSWELKIKSKIGPLTYKSVYKVPVFETEASSQNRLVAWMRDNIANLPSYDAQPLAGDISRGDVGNGITIERALEETRFVFGRARHKIMALFVTLTAAVWSVLIAILFSMGISTLLNLMVIGVGVSLLYGSVVLWLFESRLTVSTSEIRLVRGPFGFGPTKKIPSANIVDVSIEPTTKAGDMYLYSLYLKDTNGKKVLVASELEDKIKSEWLAFQIKASTTNLGFVSDKRNPSFDRDGVRRLQQLNRKLGSHDRPPQGRVGPA